MDTIMDMNKVFYLLFVLVYYRLMLHGTIFLGNCIGMFFWKNGAGYRHNVCNLFIIQCNGLALLHASGHSPADKIEERINLALIHTCLYFVESDDE